MLILLQPGQPKTFNTELLHQQLAEALGTFFRGIDGDDVDLSIYYANVHDDTPPSLLAQIQSVVDAHDPTQMTPSQAERAAMENNLARIRAADFQAALDQIQQERAALQSDLDLLNLAGIPTAAQIEGVLIRLINVVDRIDARQERIIRVLYQLKRAVVGELHG